MARPPREMPGVLLALLSLARLIGDASAVRPDSVDFGRLPTTASSASLPPTPNDLDTRGRENHGKAQSPGSSAYTSTLAVLACGGVWCLMAVGMIRLQPEVKVKDEEEFAKFKEGMRALGEVRSQSNSITLSFGSEDLECLYMRSIAQTLCIRIRQMCLGLIVYIAVAGCLSEAHDGSIHPNPIILDWSTTIGFIYNTTLLLIVGLCVMMAGLTSTIAFQKYIHADLLIISWLVIILLFSWGICFRWSLAAMLGENAEQMFLSTGNDGEFIASLEIFTIYLCIHTPLRCKILGPLILVLPSTYLVTALALGSPDGARKHMLHELAGEHHSPTTECLPEEVVVTLMMSAVAYLALWGKYVNECQSRSSFLSLMESFSLVQALSDNADGQAATGVDKANVALKHALGNLEALEAMNPADPACGPALQENIVLAKHHVELAKHIIQHADKLFEVNAQDALKGTGLADNTEVMEYISANMGGNPTHKGAKERFESRSVANEGKAIFQAEIQDSVKVEDAANLAKGWGADWSFNALQLAEATKDSACLFAGELALVRSGHCDILAGLSARRAWVRAIHSRYLPNSYHNEAHAAQVNHFSLWFAKQSGWLEKADSLQCCALLVAALAHDVGHIGRTALFCAKAQHSFALVWNDLAPLENMHAATCFVTMSGDADVLKPLEAPCRSRLRKAVVRFILATDIKEHHSSLAKLNARMDDETFLIKTADDSTEATDKLEEDVLQAGEAIIKTSDIAHGMLPWEQHCNWSYRVNLEFFEQGDEERSLGLPVSPLCDRGACNIAGGQAFFIGCLCNALFVALLRFARPNSPGADALEACMKMGEENKEKWKMEAANFNAQALSMDVIRQKFGCSNVAEEVVYPYAFEKRDVPMEPVNTAENLSCIAKYRRQSCRQ